jgi:hypothetical protein
MTELVPALRRALSGPRGTHLEAVEALRASLPTATVEDWNTQFEPGSLYDAWSQAPFVRSLYEANAATLRAEVLSRPRWRVLEVGGGDGRLWRHALLADDVGEIVVVDPLAGAHTRVAAAVPDGVRVTGQVAPLEEATLPEVDGIVCSLVLHHVAGADAAQRAQHGMTGPGKGELLAAMADAVRSRDGLMLLNEADVHCDLAAPSGDPILRERLLDSYVRRTGLALCAALEAPGLAPDLDARWRHILRHWCLDQLQAAERPPEDRDVWELDVERWLVLLARSGWIVRAHHFTDPWNLFHRYVCKAGAREFPSGTP